jgi:hypothetical protein
MSPAGLLDLVAEITEARISAWIDKSEVMGYHRNRALMDLDPAITHGNDRSIPDSEAR